MLFDRFSFYSHLFAKEVQRMNCQLYRFAYFRFLCCHFLVRLRLKNKKNIELMSKEINGYFSTCELIVLSEFVETKATNVSTYR